MNNRTNELVWLHINGDGEINGKVLKYISRNYDNQSKLDLAYFYTLTYSVPSAVLMLQNRIPLKSMGTKQLSRFKDELIFRSDKRYTKDFNRFENNFDYWKQNIDGKFDLINRKIVKDGMIREGTTNLVESFCGFGRYTAYVFIETYCYIFGLGVDKRESPKFEGGGRNTFVAGIYNAFGEDNEADYVYKYGVRDKRDARKKLDFLTEEIRKKGGDTSFFSIETSLCAYRKHFAGTRYNGFYADRQLEEIISYENRGLKNLAQLCYEARRNSERNEYLGEINGWSGIRNRLKKHYIKTGEILYMKPTKED